MAWQDRIMVGAPSERGGRQSTSTHSYLQGQAPFLPACDSQTDFHHHKVNLGDTTLQGQKETCLSPLGAARSVISCPCCSGTLVFG